MNRESHESCEGQILASRYSCNSRLTSLFDGVGFDLNQHAIINQPFYFNYRCARPNLAEKLTLRAPVLFPARNVGHKHPRADDIFECRAQRIQGALDVANRLHRLRVAIADTNDLTLLIRRSRA